MSICVFFFFKQKTAYEMRISDWSSDVCSSDLVARNALLPVSTLPVEVARPFIMPVISLAQSSNAQRCLTQAIYCEAATESDAGKAAVAQVILNRMQHPAYPNTVFGDRQRTRLNSSH